MNDILKNILLWLVIATVLLTIANNFNAQEGKMVSSVILKENLTIAIKNDADLDVIKRIYENREPIKKSIFNMFSSKESVYPYEITLSEVLEDLRADIYLKENAPEKDLENKIEKMVFDHNQMNPFDRLSKNQKDYFENIRIKSGENYHKIQNDIKNISDELYTKNSLVETYLSDSKSSYYLSIFSVIFALLVSAYQIYFGRPNKIAKALVLFLREKEDSQKI